MLIHSAKRLAQVLAVSVVALSSSAFAGTSVGAGLLSIASSEAIGVYTNSSLADDFRNTFGQEGRETITGTDFSGFCGFVGCSTTTLIVHTLSTFGPNTSTDGQLAFVSVPPVGEPSVTLALLSPLWTEPAVANLGINPSHEEVEAVVSQLAVVQSKLDQWKAEGAEIQAPFLAAVNGQCGFLGCDEELVVVYSARFFRTGPGYETLSVQVQKNASGVIEMREAAVVAAE